MLNRPRLQSAAKTGAQVWIALGGLVALELLFLAVRRLGDLKLYVVETIALGLAAGATYCIALYLLERLADRRAAFWLILAGAVLFRLTLAPLPPTLSDDIHRYRFDGRVQQVGLNPYLVRPDDPRWAALRDPHAPTLPGHDIRTVYPPLAELVYRYTWRLLPGPVGFKLPFLFADLLVVVLLAGWVRQSGARNFQLAVYAWNPLVVVEFAASGHNDSLALAATLAATLLIIGRRQMVSTLLLTAGVLAKLFPVLLFPLWLRRAGWPRTLRGWANAAAAAALTAACAWPYRSAVAQLPDTFSYYQSRWQNNNASLYPVVVWFSRSPALAAGLGVGVVAGLALWLAAQRSVASGSRTEDFARAAYLLFGATLLLAPNGYPWYFTWMVPFLCFIPNPAWLLLTVLQFLSYHVLIDYQAFGTWQSRPEMLWLTYAPFYALLLWRQFRKRRPQRPENSVSGLKAARSR
jgi:alpha-1,6-mannosyltransferase